MIWFKIRCLKDIKDTMQRWSEKSWIYTLVHQGKFEVDIDCCDVQLSDCFAAFMVSMLYLVVKICPDCLSGGISNGITGTPRGA